MKLFVTVNCVYSSVHSCTQWLRVYNYCVQSVCTRDTVSAAAAAAACMPVHACRFMHAGSSSMHAVAAAAAAFMIGMHAGSYQVYTAVPRYISGYSKFNT